MSYITGLTQFVGLGTLFAQHINDAAKAIIDQLGGSYYSEADFAYVEKPGNITSQNLSATPGFKNQQKVEPNSIFIVATLDGAKLDSSDVGCFGPFTNVTTITSIAGCPLKRSDVYINGGTLDLWINNTLVASIAPKVISQRIAQFDIPPLRIGIGGSLMLNTKNLTISGAANEFLVFTAAGFSEHVRQ